MLRYEIKYIVHTSKIPLLRSMMAPFVELDKFAKGRPENQYTVRSIYFDSPDYVFYHEKLEGIAHRLKVRLRGYNTHGFDNTVFTEIKRKYEGPIMKNRAPMTFQNALDLFHSPNTYQALQEKALSGRKKQENVSRFFYQIYRKGLIPVTTVIYEREPYHSKFDDTVRITFDKNLRAVPSPSVEQLYDEFDVHTCMDEFFILEVKFNDYYPVWMKPIIATLGVRQQAASKYCMSVEACKLIEQRTFAIAK